MIKLFSDQSLPVQCELLHQPANCILKRLNEASMAGGGQFQMCALLNYCNITCGAAKRCLTPCALLNTNSHLFLSSNKMGWLASSTTDSFEEEHELELCLTQLMSNLVNVTRLSATECIINFLDETSNTTAIWQCCFETQENADSCLNTIAQSWEELFGVPLFGNDS